MWKIVARLVAAWLVVSPAMAATVQQSGTVTVNHIPYWVTNGVIGDGGSSVDSPITSIGVTNNGGSGICVNSARQTAAGYNALCLGASTTGAATISLQNYGTATAQNLNFVINGITVTFPTSGQAFVLANPPFTAGHASCFLNTTSTLIDCGAGISAGTQWGMTYFSTTGVISSTAALTDGQIVVGQTGASPTPRSLSGDVGSISSTGAVTLAKVNGIPFNSTYTAHGVLLGEGTGAFTSTATSNVGYCLLSQGISFDPIWAACASGSGSAGGSNTQVQFNNSTSLGGSVNLTWVSPALTIGVAGTTTGQLALASSTATGTVTLQAPGVSGTYNFNFPTGAGSSGQPMISGGGGATPNTFGTLGIFGGGTNCSAASGTCLDNITGFASTGYIKRTGAGTYALSSPIPVSDGGTSLASGTSGGILGFTGTGTIASSALLAANGIVIGGGAGATPTAITACTNGQIPVGVTSAAPACQTLTGDITTVSSAGLVTIANGAITVAKQANAAAWTLEGNFTGSSAAPQFSTIGALTQKVSPAAGDYIILQDNAAAGALKFATVSSVASAGSVSSIAGNTGAFTLGNGLNNATNVIYSTLKSGPQGRITLTANTPVMTATASGQTTLRYDCYTGNQVPYFDGSIDATDTIASCEVTDAMVSAASAGQVVSANIYDVWWVHGGANRICLAMSASTGGGGGWSADTGGSNTARGTGYTQLDRSTRPYTTNKNSITNCFNGANNYGPVTANQGTYLGSVYASNNGQVSHIIGGSASGGTAALFGVWNMYNRVSALGAVTDSGTSYTYTTATIRNARNSGTNNAIVITGLAEDAIDAKYSTRFANAAATAAFGQWGIGLDSTSAFACQPSMYQSANTAITNHANTASCNIAPQIGVHTIYANENGDGTNANTFDVSGLNILNVIVRY